MLVFAAPTQRDCAVACLAAAGNTRHAASFPIRPSRSGCLLESRIDDSLHDAVFPYE